MVINSYDNSGSWETIVDAKTGEIISVKDIAVYHRHKDETSESPKRKQNNPIKQSVLKLQVPAMYMTRIRCQEPDQHMEAAMWTVMMPRMPV
ncbi:hypothetical protein EJ377_20350 [Chryseobacterium arthrosphaerae]|uniref:PepSY domain-containing protein n=1 Tax=Chryseobacterium arthrosphaerae TaxID=651561 RepID=A0A432DTY0_9FLAO|nr:hypothetical protein EJ377_20350 [Chryseobacterium arthrosphaerae]